MCFDNRDFIHKAVLENMSNLCPNIIGQYIVGALAHESEEKLAPMAGFYKVKDTEENPGRTQLRVAYVASQEEMLKVPFLLPELLKNYRNKQIIN